MSVWPLAPQLAIGWTETYVKYLDHLTTVDIKHDAPHRQRNRNDNMIFKRREWRTRLSLRSLQRDRV